MRRFGIPPRYEECRNRRPTDPFFYPTTLNPLTSYGLSNDEQNAPSKGLRGNESASRLGVQQDRIWRVACHRHSGQVVIHYDEFSHEHLSVATDVAVGLRLFFGGGCFEQPHEAPFVRGRRWLSDGIASSFAGVWMERARAVHHLDLAGKRGGIVARRSRKCASRALEGRMYTGRRPERQVVVP